MTQDYIALSQVVDKVLNAAELLARHVESLYRLTFSRETLDEGDIVELRVYRANILDLLTQLGNVHLHEPREGSPKTEWETFRRLQEIHKTIEETIKRLIAVDVLIDCALHRHDLPDKEEQMEYAHLSVLGYLNGLAMRAAEYLNTLDMEELEHWPDMIHLDDDEEDEDEDESITLPEELENFQRLRSALEYGMNIYAEEHPTNDLSCIRKALSSYLNSFSKGIKPNEEMQFTFSIGGNKKDDTEMHYLSFNFDFELIEVCSGGSVYDPAIGSDSYTNWTYSIGINGWEDDRDSRDFGEIPELIGCGALLSVDYPDELQFTDKGR